MCYHHYMYSDILNNNREKIRLGFRSVIEPMPVIAVISKIYQQARRLSGNEEMEKI